MTTRVAKLVRLASERRATLLKMCPLSAMIISIRSAMENSQRLHTGKYVIDDVRFALPLLQHPIYDGVEGSGETAPELQTLSRYCGRLRDSCQYTS